MGGRSGAYCNRLPVVVEGRNGPGVTQEKPLAGRRQEVTISSTGIFGGKVGGGDNQSEGATSIDRGEVGSLVSSGFQLMGGKRTKTKKRKRGKHAVERDTH